MPEILSQPPVNGRSSARGFGRMLVLSLAAHLTIVILFATGLFPSPSRDIRPVYSVDLVNLPVRDPQAGRPDARPEPPTEKKPEAVSPPVKPEAPKPPPAVKPEPSKTVAKEPPPKTPAKAEEKMEGGYNGTLEDIKRMRLEKEKDERIAQMRAAANAAAAAEAPVGMPTGRGKEAGVDEQIWIQNFLKECWNLSKYQVKNRDLRAKAVILFDPEGQLIDYKILQPSGDVNFDDSVRRAILKAKQLPFRPGDPLEVKAEFNLKDLLD